MMDDAVPAPGGPGERWTLLDLVTALVEVGASEREVVAAVVDLLASGRVRLVGAFCEAHLRASAVSMTAPQGLETAGI